MTTVLSLCVRRGVPFSFAVLAVFGAGLMAVATGCGGDGKKVKPKVYPPMVCEAPARPATSTTPYVVGDGTAESCDEAALRAALSEGAHVTFDCGGPVTITVTAPLTVVDQTFLDGAGELTIDGGGETRLVEVDYYATVVLSGTTFQNGHRQLSNVENGWDNAGAIYTGGHSHVYIEECLFQNNVADATLGHGGGAIYPHGAHLTVVDSEFRGNASPTGGAIHSMLSNTTLVNCLFDGNEADDGGAVFVDGAYYPEGTVKGSSGETKLCGTTFVNNIATSSSGAFFLCAYHNEATGERDRLLVDHCRFSDNQITGGSPYLGGAMRVHGEFEVRSSLFANNDATEGQGGAIWMASGDATFENTTFFGNSARWGGAVRTSDETEYTATFVNCTFAENAGNWGGALGIAYTQEVRNCIFSHNGETGNDLGYLWTCATTWGEGSAHNIVYPEDPSCGTAFTSQDPLLARELANGETTLPFDAASPAQGAGTDCPALDQLDQVRPAEGCDLGAVELP